MPPHTSHPARAAAVTGAAAIHRSRSALARAGLALGVLVMTKVFSARPKEETMVSLSRPGRARAPWRRQAAAAGAGAVLAAAMMAAAAGPAAALTQTVNPACPAGTNANFRWHYTANGNAGGWSGTATHACPGSLSQGPQAMDGNLQVAPGATLQAGYDFTLPGNHNSLTMTVAAAQVNFAVACVSGATPSQPTLTVPLPDQTYQITNDQWYPSGDQSSPLVYQSGPVTVPNLCNGGMISLAKGGTFTGILTGADTVTVTGPSNQTATTGTAASQQIQATDSASWQALTYSATGLPPGLSINSATGLISGTPTYAGTYNATVTATDTTGAHGSASFTWTVNSPNTVTVTNPGSQSAIFGGLSVQIQASDSASGQTLTYSATGLPDGLSINSATGVISGTPTTAGTSNSTVTATDTTGAQGSASFSWEISPYIPVTVTWPTPDQTATTSTPVSLQIQNPQVLVSGQTQTYSATGLPPGLSIDPATGLISGTPTTPAIYKVGITSTTTVLAGLTPVGPAITSFLFSVTPPV